MSGASLQKAAGVEEPRTVSSAYCLVSVFNIIRYDVGIVSWVAEICVDVLRIYSRQAFTNVLCARWAFNGRIVEGSYCTTQVVLKQFGHDGTGRWHHCVGNSGPLSAI